jgi:hypothetical protein
VTGHDPRDDYDDEPWRRRWRTEEYVLVPASSIIAFAVIQCVWAVFASAIPEVFYVTEAGPNLTIPVGAVAIAWNVVILWGAWRMHEFRRYRLSVLAALMSLLPVPFIYCAPISLPLGIWTLVVLCRPDVRARFEAVFRRAADSTPPLTEPPTSP